MLDFTPSPAPHLLYALVIQLTPTRSGRLPATTSDLAHAAFLHLVEQIDPALSKEIHDSNTRNPFTLSPLYGYDRVNKDEIDVPHGRDGWLRVTLLDPQFFQTFIQYFLTTNGRYPTIQLNRIPFVITHILNHVQSHPLAGQTSLSQLGEQRNVTSIIDLEFHTPTTFNLRGDKYKRQILFPDPDLVFGKLAYQWDRLTGQKTMRATEKFVNDCGLVKRYDLSTQMTIVKKMPQIGFCGRVTYQFKDQKQPDYLAHLNRLADLASYVGLGSRTGMGMGQVRRVTR